MNVMGFFIEVWLKQMAHVSEHRSLPQGAALEHAQLSA